MTKKKCGKCGDKKPYSEFHKSNSARDGVQNVCKKCRAKVDAKINDKEIWTKMFCG